MVVFIATCIIGLLSVAMGAAGDHLLEGYLTPEIRERFTVALHYHQLYSAVLLAIGLFAMTTPRGKIFTAAQYLFLFGILIFSGSLYLSIFFAAPVFTFGTPLGGVMLMAGWATLAVYGFKTGNR